MLKLSAEAKTEVREKVLEIASLALDKIKQEAEASLARILGKYNLTLTRFEVRSDLFNNICLEVERNDKLVFFSKRMTLNELISELPRLARSRITSRYGKLLSQDIDLWVLEYGSVLQASVGDRTEINTLELKAKVERRKLMRKGKKAALYLGLAVSLVGRVPAALFMLGVSLLTPGGQTNLRDFFDILGERSSFKKDLDYINML
jgi:hypothetical protein